MVKLSSIISPGFPFFISFALRTFIRDPSISNQEPGLGCNALIFATRFSAFSFQLSLASNFSIFLA